MATKTEVEEFAKSHDINPFEAELYLNKLSRRSLLLQAMLEEGMFGFEVWLAVEVLDTRNEHSNITRWLKGDRKDPIPLHTNLGEDL